MPSSLSVAYGTVGGSPVFGFTNSATWVLAYVTLSQGYLRAPPPGYPVPPYPGQMDASLTAFSQTIHAGARLQLFADDAAALVGAGAAAYS